MELNHKILTRKVIDPVVHTSISNVTYNDIYDHVC